jgi:hypothetical protein
MKTEHIEGLIKIMSASVAEYLSTHKDTTLADVIAAVENIKAIETMRVMYNDIATRTHERIAKQHGFIWMP